MMKKLTAIALGLVSLNSFAGGWIPVGEVVCYPLAHGNGGEGSEKTVFIPAFKTAGQDSLEVGLTNLDMQRINVNIKFFDADGNPYVPSQFVLSDAFSNTNHPIRGISAAGAALLNVHKTGHISILDDHYDGALTARITWQVDNCERDNSGNPYHLDIATKVHQKSSNSSIAKMPVVGARSDGLM